MRKMVDQDRGSFIREVSVHSIEPYQMCQLYPLFIKLIGFQYCFHRLNLSHRTALISDWNGLLFFRGWQTFVNDINPNESQLA